MGPGLCRKVAGWAARPAAQNGRAPLSAPKTGGFMERGCIGNSHRQNLSSTQQHATGQQTPGMRDLAARARGSCLDASLAVHPTPGAAAERKMWAHCFESREGLELDRNFSFRRICRREGLASSWQSQLEPGIYRVFRTHCHKLRPQQPSTQRYMLQAVVLSLRERALTFLVYRCGTTPKHKHPLPRRGRGLSHAAISTAACFR